MTASTASPEDGEKTQKSNDQNEQHLDSLFSFYYHRLKFSSDGRARAFYRVMLAKANQKITSHWSWPFFLPADTEGLAKEIFEEVEAMYKKDANEAPTSPSPKSSTDAGAPPSADNV